MNRNMMKNRERVWGNIGRADDSWELLSGGNWIPTCCSLGNLLMNRRKRRLWKRDDKKAGRMKTCLCNVQASCQGIHFIHKTPEHVQPQAEQSVLTQPRGKREESSHSTYLLFAFFPPLFFSPYFSKAELQVSDQCCQD